MKFLENGKVVDIPDDQALQHFDEKFSSLESAVMKTLIEQDVKKPDAHALSKLCSFYMYTCFFESLKNNHNWKEDIFAYDDLSSLFSKALHIIGEIEEDPLLLTMANTIKGFNKDVK